MREFFCKLTGWHLATSLHQVNIFTKNFYGFSLNGYLSMATSLSYTKCLKSAFEIVIVYAGWNPATCAWHKLSPRGVLQVFWKASQGELFCRTPPGNHIVLVCFLFLFCFSFFPFLQINEVWSLKTIYFEVQCCIRKRNRQGRAILCSYRNQSGTSLT